MGCLNDHLNFSHWFGNIHLSGPCNRSCYFCIGQHMMGLDSYNVLDEWPLANLEEFIARCQSRSIDEVYVTGSNTDPALYKPIRKLVERLRLAFGEIGVRTNGIAPMDYTMFDQVSLSVTSFAPVLYRLTMGVGAPPDVAAIRAAFSGMFWANVVLTPETVRTGDIIRTLATLMEHGVERVNLREPYGQPVVGDPLCGWCRRSGERFGNPVYDFHGLDVTYWDVHKTEVKSVNLYASGRISEDYAVTKGHASDGVVLDQSRFIHGRNGPQWLRDSAGRK